MRESVGKILMLAAVVNLMAGCAPLHLGGCHKTTAMGNCGSGRWEDQDEWGGAGAGNQGCGKCKLC